MQVSISEVDKAWRALLSSLESIGTSHIDLDVDYYWDIPSHERYNPYDDPKQLTLGQLSADWERLSEILKQEEPPVAHALVWLSSIVRALGEKTMG